MKTISFAFSRQDPPADGVPSLLTMRSSATSVGTLASALTARADVAMRFASSSDRPCARLSAVGELVGAEIGGGAGVAVGERVAGGVQPDRSHRIDATTNTFGSDF